MALNTFAGYVSINHHLHPRRLRHPFNSVPSTQWLLPSPPSGPWIPRSPFCLHEFACSRDPTESSSGIRILFGFLCLTFEIRFLNTDNKFKTLEKILCFETGSDKTAPCETPGQGDVELNFSSPFFLPGKATTTRVQAGGNELRD